MQVLHLQVSAQVQLLPHVQPLLQAAQLALRKAAQCWQLQARPVSETRSQQQRYIAWQCLTCPYLQSMPHTQLSLVQLHPFWQQVMMLRVLQEVLNALKLLIL